MLLLKSATVDQQLPVDQIKSMRFTSTLTTSDLVTDDVEPGLIEIFDLSGLCAGKFNTMEDARNTLPSGIYVMKTTLKTHKIIF